MADSPEPATSLLSNPAYRQAVRRILAAGFTEVRFTHTTIEAVRTPDRLQRPIEPSLITDVVSQLATLMAPRPATSVTAVAAGVSQDQWRWRKALINGVPIAMLMVGYVCFVFEYWANVMEPGRLFCGSLSWSVLAFGAFVATAIRLLSGHPESHRKLRRTLLIGAFSIPFAVWTGTAALNAWLDSGTAAPHETRVVGKDEHWSRRRGSSYSIEVESWEQPGRIDEFRVTRLVHGRVVPGHTTVRILTRPGALGFEWYDWPNGCEIVSLRKPAAAPSEW